MRSNVLVETLIGAAVLAVGVLGVAFFYTTGNVSAGAGYPVHAEFGKIGGLTVGSDVRLGGVKVGTVTDMTLDPASYRATVTMSVREEIRLPEDSVAKIVTYSLMGDPVVALEIGAEETMLSAGGRVQYTQDAVNVVDLVARLINAGVQAEIEGQDQ